MGNPFPRAIAASDSCEKQPDNIAETLTQRSQRLMEEKKDNCRILREFLDQSEKHFEEKGKQSKH